MIFNHKRLACFETKQNKTKFKLGELQIYQSIQKKTGLLGFSFFSNFFFFQRSNQVGSFFFQDIRVDIIEGMETFDWPSLKKQNKKENQGKQASKQTSKQANKQAST